MVLPSFGAFSGRADVERDVDDAYAVMAGAVWRVPGPARP
jgi:hypothetical protein